jgi:asparagine synthase (glutamine-hydrolysing)
VNYDKELQPTLPQIYAQKIKQLIKIIVPKFIINQFLRKNDWLNSQAITDEMVNSFKNNNIRFYSNINVFNELNIQWYLYFCKDLIKK